MNSILSTCSFSVFTVLLGIVVLASIFSDALVVPQSQNLKIEKPIQANSGKLQNLASSTSKSNIDYDNDDDDNDNDGDEDYDYSDNSQNSKLVVSTDKPKQLKMCVYLNPAHASTRNGPFVTYECSSRVCSDDENGSIDEESYKMRRPIFDWNSQFSHLILSNGTCDSSSLNCWHKIDINVNSLIDVMESDGIEQIEIKCTVADYVNSYDLFNYVTGEATSVLRHFKGNRAHESCNVTQDCSDGFMCMQNDNSILTDDNSSNGFCECPTQQMVAISSGSGVSTTEIRPFILVEDPHYMEQMCVPVVTYNESCLYDSQCKATDWSLFCKQIVREDGLATSDMMCDCMNGYEWATDNMLIKKCLAVPDEALNGSKVSAENGTTVEGTFDQETSSGERDLVIWWIFRPTGSTDSQQESSRHGLYYYSSRYFTLTNFAYVLAAFAIILPAILITLTLLFYCQRKLTQSRQYQPRRTSFSDSVYSDAIPTTPSEKTKSVSFGFDISPPSTPTEKTFGKTLGITA